MIVNFYKVISGDLRNKTLLTSKNIEHVPMRGEYVIYIQINSLELRRYSLI